MHQRGQTKLTLGVDGIGPGWLDGIPQRCSFCFWFFASSARFAFLLSLLLLLLLLGRFLLPFQVLIFLLGSSYRAEEHTEIMLCDNFFLPGKVADFPFALQLPFLVDVCAYC